MRESRIERMLVREVKKSGGIALKFVSPGTAGVPDRILLFPGGRIVFAELKAPGEKPTKLQLLRHARLRALGFRVVVVDDPGMIGGVIHEICSP